MAPMERIVTPHSMLAAGIVMPLVAGLPVALRLWIRLSSKTPLREHDYLILTAYTILLAMGIMFICGSTNGTLASELPLGDGPDNHLFLKTPELVATEKMKLAYSLLLTPAIGLVKLSVLTWYRRIFRGRLFEMVTITLIVVISLWIVTMWFAYLFQCGTDFSAMWSNLHDILTKCNNFAPNWQAVTIPDFVTDVLIVLIPIPFIVKLQMATTKKIGVCVAFLLGACASGAALMTLVVYERSLKDSFSRVQGIKVISTWMFWGVIELGISIIAACLPMMAPILRSKRLHKTSNSMLQFFRGLKSSHQSRTKPSRNTDSSTDKSSESSKLFDNVQALRNHKSGVRTFVSASSGDPESGSELKELITTPGKIVARTETSQVFVER